MSRLWLDIRGQAAAKRLAKAKKPSSWRDYLHTTGKRIAGVECIYLDQLPGIPEPRGIDPISESLRWEIWDRDNFTCQSCGSRRFLQIDHIYPKSKGGPTIRENLQTLCKRCNSRKSDRVQKVA